MKLKEKFDTATHARVLRLSNRIGRIGSVLTYVSTKTKETRAATLMIDKPHTDGLLQGISSTVLKETATRRQPTAVTRVRDPSQSMRANFPCNVLFFDGNGTSTFQVTKTKEIARIGIWSRKAQRLTADISNRVRVGTVHNQTDHPKASLINPPAQAGV